MVDCEDYCNFKIELIEGMLDESRLDIQLAEARVTKYHSHHYLEVIPPTEKKDNPARKMLCLQK